MAILTCACYRRADSEAGRVVPVLIEDTLMATIVVDFSDGAAKGGAAIPSGTEYLEITADAACHWATQLQASAAAAAVTDKLLGAGGTAHRRIMASGLGDGLHGISAIAAA